MNQPYRGTPCAHCGKTNGYFVRLTYDGAPESGIPVHDKCVAGFFEKADILAMEQWWNEISDKWQRTQTTSSVTGRTQSSG